MKIFLINILPPFIVKIYRSIKLRLLVYNTYGQKQIKKEIGFNDFEVTLNQIRKRGFNYFFGNSDKLLSHFTDKMIDHFNLSSPTPCENIENQKYTDELDKKGVTVLKNFFDPKMLGTWHDDFMDHLKKFNTEGMADSNVITDTRSGIMRLKQAQKYQSNINQKLIYNKDLFDICNAYLGGLADKPLNCYLDFKSKKYKKDNNIIPHFDTPFKQLKIFVPLVDIGKTNSPFVYYEKSHLPGEWRLLRDFIVYTNYNMKIHSTYSKFSFSELERLSNMYPDLIEKEKTYETKLGDVIIADTRGIHAGSFLENNYRLQLVMIVLMKGNFHYNNAIREDLKKEVRLA